MWKGSKTGREAAPGLAMPRAGGVVKPGPFRPGVRRGLHCAPAPSVPSQVPTHSHAMKGVRWQGPRSIAVGKPSTSISFPAYPLLPLMRKKGYDLIQLNSCQGERDK